MNPADCASRGIRTKHSQLLKLWIQGPEFLKLGEQQWPKTDIEQFHHKPTDPELKRAATVLVTATTDLPTDVLFSYYSSWVRLRRAVAWFTRFKSYLHSKLVGKGIELKNTLRLDELNEAERSVLRYVQLKTFPSELSTTSKLDSKTCKGLCRKSPICKLHPIVLNGLLCVGGRLGNSTLPEFTKHPIILPGDHPVTRSIINHYHEFEGHMGTSHTLAAIRQRYWILGATTAVKRIIRGCMGCKVRSALPAEQLMADLPVARVRPEYPFAATGLDYFGPFQTREGRITRKRYGCVFTCLQTRAIHIEVAYSLSIDSFLMAFSRFINRRGTPKELYSDRGTNFVGAEMELKQLLKTLDCNKVKDDMLRQQVDWHFNPPYASHRGGIWERMIRSIRRVLSAVSREQVLTEESLTTYLTEVERILNNRPLVPVLDDPDNIDVLTPNHLLLPRVSFVPTDKDPGLRHRYTRQWRQSQLMADTFWRRWLREYLPLLQSRHKWTNLRRNVRGGDLVLILGEQHTRGTWSKGVVTATIPGSDGCVRTVVLKTPDGSVTRDIRKICMLEGVGEP
ncbi:hypothetical protein CLF_105559 [Clonorchis sinensis]|uniref:Integrase catalytic domain-containing protein n=1 Tax=Clonorchis sinensis TaxID=79923 RepID=G7YPE3_CLOSI|nr:hypothetical protein CLF_105559 [Clonorchis sinensis]